MGAPPGPISRGGRSGAPPAAWRAAAAPHPAMVPPGSRRGRASRPSPARPGPPGPPPQTSGAKPRRSPRSLSNLSSIHCGGTPPPHQPSPGGRLLRLPLQGGVIDISWERGRPARTRPGKAMPSSPPRSIRNRSVPDLLCNGCFRFVPVYGPRVSQNGFRKLRTALPNCTALYR